MDRRNTPPNHLLLDQEIANAIDQLKRQGHDSFMREMDQVKQLSSLLVSWNDALLKEVDMALANYSESRAQLVNKLLASSQLSNFDLNQTSTRGQQPDDGMEQFFQSFSVSPGPSNATPPPVRRVS